MIIYKFSTPTCHMCKTITQILDSKNVNYNEINCITNEGYKLAQSYGIRSVPALIITDDENNVIKKLLSYGEIAKYIHKNF